MAKADKATAVAEIAEQFKASTATVITEYRGLSVASLVELRKGLAQFNAKTLPGVQTTLADVSKTLQSASSTLAED